MFPPNFSILGSILKFFASPEILSPFQAAAGTGGTTFQPTIGVSTKSHS